jgi:hypothetical protein
MTERDGVEERIEEILSAAEEGELSFGDIVDINQSSMKMYPEMLALEKSMLKKLNDLSDYISGRKETETPRYELVNLEVVGRRYIRLLHQKIVETETTIFSSNEVLGKDLFVVARGDKDEPVVIPYSGRYFPQLKKVLNIK